MDEPQWRALQAAHAERVRPWIEPRLARRYVGHRHPVDDFLFEYYPYSSGKLATWHPGWGVILRGNSSEFLASTAYVESEDGVTVGHEGLRKRAGRLAKAKEIVEATTSRPGQFGCFGMHEWAMVYRQSAEEIRHADHPLRLTQEEIQQVVHEVGLRCTHFDALRFFTPAAIPLNLHVLKRDTQAQDEQPGCVHAAMDLYKYAMWAYPYLPSELVADCFALARNARELDMQSSPYDLIDLGYEPILMETIEGRRVYVERQRQLAEAAGLLRMRLLDALDALSMAANCPK
ncbi:MAG: 3-methyladenine DNA glycosylase [Candidatus Nanopelagicales bacterium]